MDIGKIPSWSSPGSAPSAWQDHLPYLLAMPAPLCSPTSGTHKELRNGARMEKRDGTLRCLQCPARCVCILMGLRTFLSVNKWGSSLGSALTAANVGHGNSCSGSGLTRSGSAFCRNRDMEPRELHSTLVTELREIPALPGTL